jgi:hypothetical protein
VTRRIRLAFLPAALAAAAFAPEALAADPVSPADGARVSLRPEFVVRLAPDDTIARIFVATQPAADDDGFASGFVSYCTPSPGADPTLASCRLSLDLRPGTYYWLVRYHGSSGWRISTPRRLVASTKPAAPPPPKPKPGKPAPTGSLPRPTDGMGEFAYTVPEAPPFAGARSIVHYVTTGLDAPPLNDDDADGTPEYVEEVAAAADTALAHYASAGFREPLPDAAGPDARVDVYVEDFEDPQLLGIAVPHTRARGGAFVVISSRLDRSPKLAYGSLPAVVAHELFHVVQFAYLPDGRMPLWVAEGTATTMALEVFPKIVDFVALEYLDLWLREPWRSLHDQRFYCDRCYGGAWWWGTLSENDPRLLPEYFERLAAYRDAKRPIRLGLKALGEVFRRHGLTLGQAFAGFSLGLYKAGMSPSLAYGLKARARTHRTRVRRINGLATHYVGLTAPAGARRLVVHVDVRRGQLAGSLAVGGPKGRLVFSRNGSFTVRLRSARERRRLVLVLTSPASSAAAYRISYRAA